MSSTFDDFVKALFRLSNEKSNHKKALNEWSYIYKTTNNEGHGDCICGYDKKNLKYRWFFSHKLSGNIIVIGSVCINHFLKPYYPDSNKIDAEGAYLKKKYGYELDGGCVDSDSESDSDSVMEINNQHQISKTQTTNNNLGFKFNFVNSQTSNTHSLQYTVNRFINERNQQIVNFHNQESFIETKYDEPEEKEILKYRLNNLGKTIEKGVVAEVEFNDNQLGYVIINQIFEFPDRSVEITGHWLYSYKDLIREEINSDYLSSFVEKGQYIRSNNFMKKVNIECITRIIGSDINIAHGYYYNMEDNRFWRN